MIASLGIPLINLQVLIVFGVAILIVGYILFTFWQHIVFGLAGIACFFVLCSKENMDTGKIETPIAQHQIAPKHEPTDKDMFIEDCQSATDYSKSRCEDIWEDREHEEAELALAKYKVKKHSIKRNL